MNVTLQGAQFAFFFKNKNQKTHNILNDALKTVFNGAPSIESLPDIPVFDEIPALNVSSENKEKRLQGTRLRLDYFYNKEILVDKGSLEVFFNEMKKDVSLIRDQISMDIGVKRIGYVLNFKFISETEINTSVLLSDEVPGVISGGFDNSSVRLVKKHKIADMKINNVLFLNLDDDKLKLYCQRDFNTLLNEDYTSLLTAEKIISFVDDIKSELNLEEVSKLFD